MKKIFLQSSLLYLIVFSFLASCHGPSTLPDITSEGRGTFGAMVNGSLWLPCCGPNHQPTTIADQSTYGFISVGADNKNSGMRIAVNDASGIKTNHVYMLTNTYEQYSEYYIGDDHSTCFYEAEHMIDGKVIFSRLGEIVSGTFEFRMLNPECSSDTINVTQGRFDLR